MDQNVKHQINNEGKSTRRYGNKPVDRRFREPLKNMSILILCILWLVSLVQIISYGCIIVEAAHGNLMKDRREIPTTTKDDSHNNGSVVYFAHSNQIEKTHLMRFQEYYRCLNDSKIRPMAHYVMPGTSVQLNCKAACLSPHRNSIEWRYSNKLTNFTEKTVNIEKSVNTHIDDLRWTTSDDNLVLTLYGLKKDYSGHYNCLQDGSVISPHLIQVADSSENLAKKKRHDFPNGTDPSSPIVMNDIGIKVWTKWGNWSSCSKCTQVGKRIRIGICMVSTITSTSNKKEMKILEIFPEGLPCRSSLLPEFLQRHAAVQSRKNEYMVGFCKEPCAKKKIFLLKETAGILLEKLKQPGQPFALLKQLPHVPPSFKHSVLYFKQWDTAYVQCPRSDHNDAPVYWRRGLNLMIIETDRVHLTPTHILVINDIGISDSGVYSCWQRDRLVGAVRLTVFQPVRLSFEEQISAIILISVIISFIVVSLRMLRAYLKRRRIYTQLRE